MGRWVVVDRWDAVNRTFTGHYRVFFWFLFSSFIIFSTGRDLLPSPHPSRSLIDLFAELFFLFDYLDPLRRYRRVDRHKKKNREKDAANAIDSEVCGATIRFEESEFYRVFFTEFFFFFSF